MKKNYVFKFASLGLSLCLLFSLSGCGNEEQSTQDVTQDVQSSQESTDQELAQKYPEELAKELSIKDVKYDAQDGTITGTIINPTNLHFNYVLLTGTADYETEDEWGDPVKNELGIDGSTMSELYFVSNDGLEREITDIPANGEKPFTLVLTENDVIGSLKAEKENISNPQIQVIAALTDEAAAQLNTGRYLMPDEYEVNFAYDEDNAELNVEISNNSAYRWVEATAWIEYTYEDESKQVVTVTGSYIDKDDRGELTADRVFNASDFKVLYVKFVAEQEEQ